MALTVVRHPLLDDVLASLRDRRTGSSEFRQLAHRASLLVAAEATRDLATKDLAVETPLETATAQILARRVVAVPVLRAGLGMLEAFLDLVPSAEVGYFGLERDEQTAVARRYYEKVPKDLGEAVVYLLDPMLATGGSAAKGSSSAARGGCASSASSRHPKASRTSNGPHPRPTSTRQRSTASSTTASSSCRDWETSATGCSGRSVLACRAEGTSR